MNRLRTIGWGLFTLAMIFAICMALTSPMWIGEFRAWLTGKEYKEPFRRVYLYEQVDEKAR